MLLLWIARSAIAFIVAILGQSAIGHITELLTVQNVISIETRFENPSYGTRIDALAMARAKSDRLDI